MNSGKAKQLRKIMLSKTSAVLLLVREQCGEDTKSIETPQAVWRKFKQLYKEGKIPQSMFKTTKRRIIKNGNNIEFKRSRV